MYYPIGRCVMKKTGSHPLPTMIAVAEEVSVARSLSKALCEYPNPGEEYPMSTQVSLVVHGQERLFYMNDRQSVNNVLVEVEKNAKAG